MQAYEADAPHIAVMKHIQEKNAFTEDEEKRRPSLGKIAAENSGSAGLVLEVSPFAKLGDFAEEPETETEPREGWVRQQTEEMWPFAMQRGWGRQESPQPEPEEAQEGGSMGESRRKALEQQARKERPPTVSETDAQDDNQQIWVHGADGLLHHIAQYSNDDGGSVEVADKNWPAYPAQEEQMEFLGDPAATMAGTMEGISPNMPAVDPMFSTSAGVNEAHLQMTGPMPGHVAQTTGVMNFATAGACMPEEVKPSASRKEWERRQAFSAESSAVPLCAMPAAEAAPPVLAPAAANVPPEWADKHTVMMRNLPNKYTQFMLLEELNQSGFLGAYDFLYLPIDTETDANRGYAFVNFISPAHAWMFKTTFDGQKMQRFNSDKVVLVVPAALQGFEANYAHYSSARVSRGDPAARPLFLRKPDGNAANHQQTSHRRARRRQGSMIDHASRMQRQQQQQQMQHQMQSQQQLQPQHHQQQQHAMIIGLSMNDNMQKIPIVGIPAMQAPMSQQVILANVFPGQRGSGNASSGPSQLVAKFCPFCGHSSQPEWRFCQNCGSNLKLGTPLDV